MNWKGSLIKRFGITGILFSAIFLFPDVMSHAEDINERHSYVPEEGFVPNERTAIAIGNAVLVEIYGKRILRQQPFIVSLEDDVWIVRGVLRRSFWGLGPMPVGGVAEIRISKSDGTIVRVTHGS